MELFHRLSSAECGEVRAWIVHNSLKEKINFRNVDVSDSALKALQDLTASDAVPVLSTDSKFYFGKLQIIEYLKTV